MEQTVPHDCDVLVIGRNCVDTIWSLERFPAENQKAPLSFECREGGGQGGTSACCVSALGGRVALKGLVGDDSQGNFCRRRLQDFKVSTQHLQSVKNAKTPTAQIFVTRVSGRRTILYEPSTLPKICLDVDDNQLLQTANVILLDPETTYLVDRVSALKSPQSVLVYDCERWREKVDRMMQAADYFIPSSDFLDSPQLAFNNLPRMQKIRRLQEKIKGQLVVTAGSEGAFFPHQGNLFHVAAPAVDVVDTTGAGDNFHGAFALAVARGFDLFHSVRFAVAVASLSCRAFGGRNALPSLQQALQTADMLEIEAIASASVAF